MTFDRAMMIFFAVVTVTLLVFRRDTQIHHHFYGGIGDGDVGQAHHLYSGGQSQLRPTEQWTPSIPEPMIKEPSVDPLVSYENYDFRELPIEVKNAAVALGYTPAIWDYGEEDPPVFSKPWFMLTMKERNAAETLGFSEELWGNDEYTSSSTSSPAEGESEEYENYSSDSESEEDWH